MSEEKPEEPPPVPAPAPAPEPEAEAEKPTASPQVPSFLARIDLALTIFVLAIGVVLLAWLQFATPELIDHDSLYHVESAHQLAVHGDRILSHRKFPWMQGTFLRDHYADKEFLFHAVLMPFCASPQSMDGNAKIATIVLGALVLIAFALALRGARMRHVWLWLLLFLGAGENFAYRLLEVRPHLLSIALVLLGVRFVLERRFLFLYFTGFLLAWSYSGPQILPCLALAAALARYARDEEIEWKPFAGSVVGVVSGFILNPFVPNNLYLWRVQSFEVLLRAWGIQKSIAPLGGELYPFTTRDVLLHAPGMCFALALAVLALLFARRKPSARTVQLGALAIPAAAALFLSAKFLDYAAPLAILFAASAVDDQWRTTEPSPSLRRSILAGAFGLAVVFLVGLSAFSTKDFVRQYFADPPGLRGAAGWLQGHAKGATVLHFERDDFSVLFHDNPDSFYLYGLDPTFMEVWRPDLLAYLQGIHDRKHPLDRKTLLDLCDGIDPKPRFLVVWRGSVEETACHIEGLEPAHQDDRAVVFALE